MTVTGPAAPPPRRSSSAVIVRPIRAGTPRTSKNRPLAQIPSTISVWPLCARLNRPEDHAVAPATRSSCARICSHTGLVKDVSSSPNWTSASWLGSFTGSVRSTRVSRIEKMAVFAPIPSASDSSAIAVTTGVDLRALKASRMSGMTPSTCEGCNSLVTAMVHNLRVCLQS